MPSKKSIYRRPDAQHFQLVHRSQRDPLIHDPDASPHVLKPFHRENDVRKGKTRADLESLLSPADLAHDAARANIGEASQYGIYYDDTEYDYMQHLREAGVVEDGVDTVMLPAPTAPTTPAPGSKPTSNRKGKGKGRAADTLFTLVLPREALPSATELPRAHAHDAQQAVPAALAGLQPHMDPHLRQTLAALDEDAFVDDALDDAFVDDALDDAFFRELVRDGERAPAPGDDDDGGPGHDGAPAYPFREEGLADGEDERAGAEDGDGDEAEDEPWEARFARFQARRERGADASDADGASEGADTVERLPVIGGKKRRRGAASASSGFSMTSSAVFRNAGLSLLDERYDQIEKLYQDDGDDPLEDGEDPEDEDDDEDDDEPPDLLAARDDFEAVMDDFLDNYELVGRRMRPVLAGDTATAKLDTVRRAFGGLHVAPHDGAGADDDDDDDNDADIPMPADIDEKPERWDCETILSTYTNLENHPRLIRARDEKPVPKIRLDPRTGLPSVAGVQESRARGRGRDVDESGDEDEDADADDLAQPERVTTTARPRNESKEDKKARKQAVKQDRQARRLNKAATREQFLTERKHQVKVLANKPPSGTIKL